MKDEILKVFLTEKETLDAFKERVINLISDLLRQEKINIHHISGRTKEYESLSKKIDKKLDKYNSLCDITDLVGIRIISYLESDVDRIAKLIKDEFFLDEHNSIDKRELNNDQFGYKSLHLVISLNETRAKLTEYKGYETVKCEIQIRSILQHAWAEIEHDLGYKGKSAIPNQYKRNFNRLAALLETADIEFDRLKRELSEYENDVVELIRTTPQTVQIDQASISQFNLENQTLKEARELLAEIKLWNYTSTDNVFHGIIERFEFFNFNSIKDIEDELIKNKVLFFKFIIEFTKGFTYDEITIGIVLYYFQHFLAAKTEDIEYITKYLDYGPIKISSEGGFVERIIESYQKTKNSR